MLELKTYTINLKSFDQDIPDFIVGSAGDAYGRTLRIIMTQEAKAQVTPHSKLYLSWHHEDLDLYGLNYFTQVEDNPFMWEIKYPPSMCLTGTITAAIKLVDNISIVNSQNFTIEMSAIPEDSQVFENSNDFSVFQDAIIKVNSFDKEFEYIKQSWEEMREELTILAEKVSKILEEKEEEDGDTRLYR